MWVGSAKQIFFLFSLKSCGSFSIASNCADDRGFVYLVVAACFLLCITCFRVILFSLLDYA